MKDEEKTSETLQSTDIDGKNGAGVEDSGACKGNLPNPVVHEAGAPGRGDRIRPATRGGTEIRVLKVCYIDGMSYRVPSIPSFKPPQWYSGVLYRAVRMKS